MHRTNDYIAVREMHNILCLQWKVDHQKIKAWLFKVIPNKDPLTSLLLMFVCAMMPKYIMYAKRKTF